MGNSENRMLLIYNSKAGRARIKNNLHEIVDIFVRGGFSVNIYSTQQAGDALNKVKNREQGMYDIIVCSGGDGTLDEVINGVIQSGEPLPIGYIPAGSTNDFAKSLGISNDMIKAAEDIVNGKLFPCDVGRFNGDAFAYIAAFGIFTDVSYETEQELKNVMGHMAYILKGVQSLSNIKSYHVLVKSEEMTLEDEFLYGMITNSTSVGGFQRITGENVKLDDGLFEVTLVKKPANLAELNEILMSVLKRKMESSCFCSFKTSHVELYSEEAIDWTLDGEFGGKHKNVIIDNQQKALQIVKADK